MPDDDHWKKLIADAATRRSLPVKALHYLGITYPSCSKPVLMACSDGRKYVVKWFNPPRMIVNDQIIGTLGSAMGAPVPEVRLIDIASQLVAATPAISHMRAGLCHGSRFLDDVSESRENFNFMNIPENRPRFAMLAALYGLAYVAADHQFIYKKQPPRLVFSYDHGHFFPDGPNWTVESLGRALTSGLDLTIMEKCYFTPEEITIAVQSLKTMDNSCIAAAVAAPPDDWGLAIDGRIAMARYLEKRRDNLLRSMDDFAKGDQP